MAVDTGLLDFAKIKPSDTKVATFRATWKKQTASHPQPNLPAKCTIHARDVSGSLMGDIRNAIHLRRSVDNPGKTTMVDLLLFGNSDAVFYARQGRLSARGLLAL